MSYTPPIDGSPYCRYCKEEQTNIAKGEDMTDKSKRCWDRKDGMHRLGVHGCTIALMETWLDRIGERNSFLIRSAEIELFGHSFTWFLGEKDPSTHKVEDKPSCGVGGHILESGIQYLAEQCNI